MARHLTSADTPPFEAEYAPVPPAARATEADGEEVQTMDPPFPSPSMARKACLHVRKTPERLVESTRSQVS
jgi:hypothetical protein